MPSPAVPLRPSVRPVAGERRSSERERHTQLISSCIHLDNFFLKLLTVDSSAKGKSMIFKEKSPFHLLPIEKQCHKKVVRYVEQRCHIMRVVLDGKTVSIYYFHSSAVYTQTWKILFFFFSVRLFYIYAFVFCSPPPYGMSACVCAERMWRMNGAARSQQLGHHPAQPCR